jgi:hypothetical protein
MACGPCAWLAGALAPLAQGGTALPGDTPDPDGLEPPMACGPCAWLAGALALPGLAGAASTLFGVPGTLASGLRRYSGSGGPSGSPAARRRAHHRAAVAALG